MRRLSVPNVSDIVSDFKVHVMQVKRINQTGLFTPLGIKDRLNLESLSCPMSAPHPIQVAYDLVFAGGGTAACIAASRLATAFPDLSILVLEMGPTTKDKIEHIQPGRFLTHLAPTSTTAQFNVSKPSENVGGRSVIVPSGRCVGGGSSINWMLYNRPAASDFDDWEKKFGNVGWAAKDLIPMLEKVWCFSEFGSS